MKALPLLSLLLTLVAMPATAAPLFKGYKAGMPMNDAIAIDKAEDCSSEVGLPQVYCVDDYTFAGIPAGLIIYGQDDKLRTVAVFGQLNEETVRAFAMAMHGQMVPLAYENHMGVTNALDFTQYDDTQAEKDASLMAMSELHMNGGGTVVFMDKKFAKKKLVEAASAASPQDRIVQVMSDLESQAVFLKFQTLGAYAEDVAIAQADAMEQF